MKYAVYNSNLGFIKITYEDVVVISIEKVNELTNENNKNKFTDEVFKEINEYLNGKRKIFSFKYELRGTSFQKKVWKALCEIPYGETRTYKEVATQIGNEKASRAVGMANNKNPIMITIPCHRVIGSNNKLVGYAGGLEMKKYLLDMEKNNK